MQQVLSTSLRIFLLLYHQQAMTQMYHKVLPLPQQQADKAVALMLLGKGV
jgi:hypothetical protein